LSELKSADRIYSNLRKIETNNNTSENDGFLRLRSAPVNNFQNEEVIGHTVSNNTNEISKIVNKMLPKSGSKICERMESVTSNSNNSNISKQDQLAQ